MQFSNYLLFITFGICIINGQGRIVKVDYDDNLNCTGSSGVTNIDVHFISTYEDRSCDMIGNYEHDFVFNITMNDQIVYAIWEKSDAILRIHEGYEAYVTHGLISEGECEGGTVYFEFEGTNPDPSACDTEEGVTALTDDNVILEISGGKCDTECTGSGTLRFTPGIRN